MKNILAFALVTFFVFISNCQSTYFIKDGLTFESIPFVKVRPDIGTPFLADIDGKIVLENSVLSIELRSSGYADTMVLLSNVIDNTIYISPLLKEIQEVKVVAGENPAHRIIDLAIANRKLNNPMENDAFRYESYSKFIFDANQDALDAIPEGTSDSTLIKIKSFFSEQHLFMMESASTRTFIPPSRDKEEISAYKVSGFTDPMFSTFANSMQSFSFYENQFQLMGKTYINPIAFGGTRRYLFSIEDTTIVKQDTTFTIFYRPHKGKNFDGMTGRLYINTNGYAIEKVTASPYEDTTGTEIIIVQEYELINGKKWFPSKLSTEISLKGVVLTPKLKDGYIQGKGSTYIKNVVIDPEGLSKRDFNNVSVITKDDAGEVKDDVWDSLRVYDITKKEERTYEMIDSLSKAEKFDKKMAFMNSLLEGKLPLGLLNLDLMRVADYNRYEGCRLGAGLETSKKMMKNVIIGAYYGWGTNDKEAKYGGYSTLFLNRQNGIKLNLRYQQDLLERGGTAFQKDIFGYNQTPYFRRLFIQNMERQRLGEFALSGIIKSNMKLTLIGNYQRIWYTEGYQFYPNGLQALMTEVTDIDLAETSLEFTWNIREKVMQLGAQRMPKGTKYPKITFKATKGWEGIFESNYNYIRLYSEIHQDLLIRGLGKFSWSLVGSQTIGNVPLFLMQVGNGTGLNWNLSVMNTFETMRPSEFYNTRQVALFTRMTFNSLKTKAKWNEPQFAIHNAFGYGDMDQKVNHSVSFRSMDKGFFETGLILNNVLIMNSYGIGIGAFYRYGYYAQSNWKMNIVPKITFSIAL